MNKFERKLRVIGLSFAFLCLSSISSHAITVSEVKSFIDSLPLADFNNADSDTKASILKELDAVSDTLNLRDIETNAEQKAALKQDALNNLTTLKDKNSGCTLNGTPSEDDSVINCTSQQDFYVKLTTLINDLNQN